MEFESFQKIARLNREIVITEKIDGTNGQIFIFPITSEGMIRDFAARDWLVLENGDFPYAVMAGSRNRWLAPGKKDNFGFASFVHEHGEELLATLGPGRHFGEWWGDGIQRGYGLDEKHFSLFNTGRWNSENKPECCSVVPVVYQGDLSQDAIDDAIEMLKDKGSVAAVGYDKPEGVVVFHTAGNQLYKVTCEDDGKPKSVVESDA